MGEERERTNGNGNVSQTFTGSCFKIPHFLAPHHSLAMSSVMASHALVPLITNVSRFAYLQDLLQVGGAGDEGGVAGVLRAVGGVAVEGVRRRRRRGRGGGRVAVEEF